MKKIAELSRKSYLLKSLKSISVYKIMVNTSNGFFTLNFHQTLEILQSKKLLFLFQIIGYFAHSQLNCARPKPRPELLDDKNLKVAKILLKTSNWTNYYQTNVINSTAAHTTVAMAAVDEQIYFGQSTFRKNPRGLSKLGKELNMETKTEKKMNSREGALNSI